MLSDRLAASSVILLVMVLAGCAERQASNACPDAGVRLYVTSNGVVTLNGETVEADGIGAALAALNPQPTVACYSRDSATAEPHPASSQVVNAIIQQRLPVTFYTDKTFTVAVKME